MPFSKLLGNDPAKSYLIKMLENKSLPNTLLFHGMEGVGKKQFAIALAKALMGKEHVRKIVSGNHPDLHFYAPEGKSCMHSIGNLRALLEESSLAPFEAPCKVFIIEDAEKMLPTSSNALLKTLEEPPLQCYIILLSSEAESLLPTLLSRCRKLHFFPIPESEITAYLVQEKIDPDEAKRIALLSQGSLSKAQFLIQGKQDPNKVIVQEILDQKLYNEPSLLLQRLAKIEEGGEEEDVSRIKQIDAIFEEILFWFREHAPFALMPVLEIVSECRLATQRSIKLRVVLNHFFLQLQKMRIENFSKS